MAARCVIVGLGEAVLAESLEREEPAGLAALVAIHATGLGHTGIAISRLGQDPTADVLLARLRELGVDVDHLQSDPDLATGRIIERAVGSRTLVDARAAYDNLQWDFDLDDVAQRADAVIFGALIRRSGQARSAADRFLARCRLALRVFDVTNRTETVSRNDTLSGFLHAEVAVVDDVALRALVLDSSVHAPRDAALELLRQHQLQIVLYAQEGQPLTAHTADSTGAAPSDHRRDTHEAAVVGFVHGVVAGWELSDALALARRFADHVLANPGQPAPPELLQRC